ncbi:unnamed protein product [Dicrocoelium dendriticum]|nr:unnamed protein product [Dicrocoelium dendriticum]
MICKVLSQIHCEDCASSPLKECNDNTCLNGGSCTGPQDKPSCSCPEGVTGPKCERRIRFYSVGFLMLKGTKNFLWDIALADKTSTKFQKYSKVVITTLEMAAKLGSDPTLVQSFVSCENVTFTPGSVWVTVTLKFDFNNTMAAVYSTALVFRHLQMGGFRLLEILRSGTIWIPTDFGRFNSTTFYVTAIDPCESNNHDCSKNAICKTMFNGVYACECHPFTIDASSDRRYPGRRCVYDGLIIFTFVTIGIILSSMVFILCGCRRTIWYRRRNNTQFENVTLVKMPSNYDI